MIVPLRAASARASGFATALGLLCLTGLTGFALPQTVRAQTTPPADDAAKVPMPTVVLHLRAENAAPTRAVLHERMLTGLSIHGAVQPPESAKKSPVVRLVPSKSDTAATTKALEELGKKHAAAHPPIRVPNQHDVDKQKADDAALLTSVAKQSPSGAGFMDFAALAKNFHGVPPLSVDLTPSHPSDPSGRAHLTFIAPKAYLPDANLVTFQNTGLFAHKVGGFFSSKEVYTPDSCLVVDVKVQAGKTYFILANAYWGTFPFNEQADAVTNFSAIHVSTSNDVGIADGKEMLIPGGTPKTSMVMQCDKDGWYTLIFAGLANAWSFQGIQIKEITP